MNKVDNVKIAQDYIMSKEFTTAQTLKLFELLEPIFEREHDSGNTAVTPTRDLPSFDEIFASYPSSSGTH